MSVNRNIKVTLSDDEYIFLKWLAKRDRVTISQELKQLFYLQLSEEMDLYKDESGRDKNVL